ncbi:MAG: HEAT repeat domain-containing protein, partial [Planctomycetota bacterium]
FRFGLPSGMGARMVREMMDNSMATPVRSLIYNAMPPRFRGRVRAFLEGIVVYAGMSVAGVVLLVFRNPDPLWLCAAGIGAAVFYLLANWKARSAYLHTLVDQLREGRLDLSEVGDELGRFETSRLATLWEVMLREEGRRPSRSLLQMIPGLAARGILDPLVRAASHPNPDVRRSSINALASTGAGAAAGPLALALDDPDPRVRLSALRGLSRIDRDPSFLLSRLEDLLRDPDSQVRAEAALRGGTTGLEVLSKMIDSEEADDAIAAMHVAPPALLDAVASRATDRDAGIRAAALECLARISPEAPFDTEELLDRLHDPDARVRRAVVLLLANLDDDDAVGYLAGCLADPSSEVQFAAETVLISLGEDALPAVEPYLRSELERAVEGALRVVAASGAVDSASLLTFELRRRVRELWYEIIAYQHLPDDETLAIRFLRAAFRDGMLRSRRLAFRILELLENPGVIRKVDREMRVGTERSRGDALEVLSNLGDRESARLLVLIHESAPLEERTHVVERFVLVPDDPEELIEAARRAEHRWIRMGAEAAHPREGESHEEETMERLLALKQLELFGNLSLEQLEAVNQVTREVEFLPGEVIVEEGEPGDELYLLLEGEVRFLKNRGSENEIPLSTMTAVDYFGEMAILDDEPRAASAVAVSHTRLLSLDGGSLKDLILQM